MHVRAFVAIARIAPVTPHFLGKSRIFLTLYKLLGLQKRHIVVSARLRRPVPFVAELDLHSWLQRIAFLTGGYEHETVELLRALHRYDARGGYLLDVGANIGLISIPFAMQMPTDAVAVVAVEAVPDNVRTLRANVDRNGLSRRIQILPFGLGDESARVQIQVEGDLETGAGTGTANILPPGSTHECVRQEIVIRTLDELVTEGQVPSACSVIKIDTDGYDLKVLQGASAFLLRERPVIFGEFSAHCLRWHGQSLADIVSFAEAHGYQVWRRLGSTLRFEHHTAVAHVPYSDDLLLVPEERLESFLVLISELRPRSL